MADERFERSSLADFDAGRSRRPRDHLPTLELISQEPRAAFIGHYVRAMWQDFVTHTRLDLDLAYVLRGCVIAGFNVNGSDDDLIRLRRNIIAGRHDDLIAKYNIYNAKFVKFPDITRAEETEFGNMARSEVKFDLSAVRPAE